MIKQLISSQSKTITGAAIIIGSASFLSRLIGVARDRVFAHIFGASTTLDAYYAAFRIPDLVYNLLIVGALSAGFIPIFTKLFSKDKSAGWLLTNRIINIICLSLIIVTLILYIYTPTLVTLIAPGFDPATITKTISLTRIMLLSPIILGLSGIISGVLQSLRSFFIYSLSPILYNIGIIFGAIFLVPIYGVDALGFGVVIGALLHLLVQLPSTIHHGYRYRLSFGWRDKNVRKIFHLMLPRTIGLATVQINILIMTMLASTTREGGITIFNFANNLQYFPIGIIGVSYAIAAFPALSAIATNVQMNEKFREYISDTTRQILFFIIPLTIIFLLLRAQIVRIVFGSGAFDWSATISTADALAFFTLSMFAQAISPLLIRAFFALEDTITPLFIGILSTIVTIISAVYFRQYLGISGLALGFSIGAITQLTLLWLSLRHKIGSIYEYRSLRSLYKISIAGMFMAVIVQLIKLPIAIIVDMTKFWGIFSQGLIAGGLGLITYFGICSLLGLEELHRFKDSMEKRFLKIKKVEGDIGGSSGMI